MYNQCHIENINGSWYILWPDSTKAWPHGYKTRGWATRILNWSNREKSK